MPNLEVKRSLLPGAGQGVFAARDYAAGEFVCLYRGERKLTSQMTPQDWDYSIASQGKGDNETWLCGAPGYSADCPLGVGQLVNDASQPDLSGDWVGGDDEDSAARAVSAVMYEQEMKSATGENLSLQRRGNLVAFVAKRALVAGEELYFSYSALYWVYWYRRRAERHSSRYDTLTLVGGMFIGLFETTMREQAREPSFLQMMLSLGTNGAMISGSIVVWIRMMYESEDATKVHLRQMFDIAVSLRTK
jgi:hypothetical protein